MIDARRIEHTAQPGFGLCWASCAAMLLQAAGVDADAATIAADLFGVEGTNVPQLEEHELSALFGRLGLRTAFYERPLEQAELDAILDEHRPVCIALGREGTDDGHAVVIAGRSGDEYRVLDPQLTERWVRFPQVERPRSHYAWAFTWELLSYCRSHSS